MAAYQGTILDTYVLVEPRFTRVKHDSVDAVMFVGQTRFYGRRKPIRCYVHNYDIRGYGDIARDMKKWVDLGRFGVGTFCIVFGHFLTRRRLHNGGFIRDTFLRVDKIALEVLPEARKDKGWRREKATDKELGF